jgi:hypothetical protein
MSALQNVIDAWRRTVGQALTDLSLCHASMVATPFFVNQPPHS